MAHLLAIAWELSERFEPGGIKFSTWAKTTLSRRTVDWIRQHRGRTRWQFSGGTYERPRTQLLSFDGPTEIAWDSLSETAAWTMTHIAFPISCGLSTLEGLG